LADWLDGDEALIRRLDALGSDRAKLGLIGLAAVREGKVLVPRRTGNLGRTIRLGTVTDDYADVLAGGRLKVGYAAAVEFGTRPHVIRPRRRKSLAWGGPRTLSGRLRSGGRPTHFAKEVHHPGTQAKPYLVPGIKKALRRAGMDVLIRDPWNRAA
jgi:hypothetical protein